MNKGIVMEIKIQTLIVMTPEGVFYEVPRQDRSCVVGEEIRFAIKQQKRKLSFAILSMAAAAAIFCFIWLANVWSPGNNSNEIVAYVTIDINPSVEMGIDEQEVVRDMRGINADGQKLIEAMTFKGVKLQMVTDQIIQRASDQHYLDEEEGDILVSSTAVRAATKLDMIQLTEKIKEEVVRAMVPAAVNYEVIGVSVSEEIRQEAKENDISVGKYVLFLNAQQNGLDIPLATFKEQSIHHIIKGVENKALIVPPSVQQWSREASGNLMPVTSGAPSDEAAAPKPSEAVEPPTVSPTEQPGPLHSPVVKPSPPASEVLVTPGKDIKPVKPVSPVKPGVTSAAPKPDAKVTLNVTATPKPVDSTKVPLPDKGHVEQTKRPHASSAPFTTDQPNVTSKPSVKNIDELVEQLLEQTLKELQEQGKWWDSKDSKDGKDTKENDTGMEWESYWDRDYWKNRDDLSPLSESPNKELSTPVTKAPVTPDVTPTATPQIDIKYKIEESLQWLFE